MNLIDRDRLVDAICNSCDIKYERGLGDPNSCRVQFCQMMQIIAIQPTVSLPDERGDMGGKTEK